MRYFALILIAVLSSCFIEAQNVLPMIRNYSFVSTNKVDEFEYITSDFNLSQETEIGLYKLTINKQGKNWLAPVFDEFWQAANKIGANSFAIEKVDFVNDQYIVEVSIHYLNKLQMQENFSLYDKNTVVVFGDLNTKNVEGRKSFKVNKDKHEVAAYSYILFRNKIGNRLKISVGGFMGSSVSVLGEQNKLARCFSLGGTTVMPAGGVAVGNRGTGVGVGLSISTGSVYPMGLSFGLFTMTILNALNNTNE